MKTFLSAFILAFGFSASAANYKYNELMIKDYDEMQAMVEAFVQKSRNSGGDDDDSSNDAEAVSYLKEALKLIFSRPDSDNMVAKLVSEIRRELLSYNAFEPTIAELADEALAVAKNKNAAPSVQSTSLFVLENILSQIRPEVSNNNNQVFRGVIERVAKADIEVSNEVFKDRKLRGMFKNKNPTEVANEILKKLPKPEKEKKKK